MLRPNLYSALTAMVMMFTVQGQLFAQAQYCPPEGVYPQSHAMHLPRSEYQAPIVDHYVQSAPKLWDDQQPIEWFVGELARRSWIRVEYLHWNIEKPGDGLIGAPVNGLNSVNQQFEAFDNLNGGVSVGTSRLQTNEVLDLDDVSGVRGTWGLALNGGQLELNFFGTEQRNETFTTGNLRNFRAAPNLGIGNPVSPNVVLPLTTNGGVNDTANLNAIVFDDRVGTEMASQLWGTEASFLTDPYLPGEGFQWQWLGGFRYVNLDESFSFTGVNDAGNTLADRVTRINSSTVNNMYGPQFGGRASLASRWVTFSATPRIVLGLNDYSNTVSADPLGTGTFTSESNEDIDFNTITQLNLAGEIHLNTHLSLYGGYDFMWMPRVSRPHTNIRYNSTPGAGGDFVPDIGLDSKLKNFMVEGLSVGAVFRY